MKISVQKRYLWMPVSIGSQEIKLNMYVNEMKIQEIDIHFAKDEPEYYACMDMSRFMNQELKIVSDEKEFEESKLIFSDKKPENNDTHYPQIHFAPETGWINDPNGLIYDKGVYHLFYQYNPYGCTWGNMQWGHATSPDLLHWDRQEIAMEPDCYGTVYSGCAIKDEKNLLGYGEDTLLFYYTAAGGRNEWSVQAGNLFTQRLAYSIDGGKTLIKSDRFVLPHIEGENRDPKIFWHGATESYICVLYLDNNDFLILRSTDLLHWEQTQKLTVPGMWECPDLMELSVVNIENEKKWVFFSADGYYQVGHFDGREFHTEQEVQMAYATRLPYAAQSYSGVGDQVIAVPWFRMDNHRENYRGQMGMPMRLSLRKTKGKYCLKFTSVVEYEKLKKEETLYTLKDEVTFSPEGTAGELNLKCPVQTRGQVDIWIGQTHLCLDFDEREGKLLSENKKPLIDSKPQYLFSIDDEHDFDIRILVDEKSVEVLAYKGCVYAAIEQEEAVLKQDIRLSSSKEEMLFSWKKITQRK
ncbi:MAG: hypothetical protein PHC41_10655 [Lachnospiraceae bacterium]|nr:hypothetical protein [Lachnospiraceae bacterium]MDD3616668.1 hypothetical protein [Lachnospiraceae bacterium]